MPLTYHATYFEDNLLKDYFFVKHLFHIKRFSNTIVFKFSKNVELKIVNNPEIG